MRKILALVLSLLWLAPASAQIVGTLPFTLQNGTIADANQVMADLNTVVAAVNANAATAGANSNITALNGLTTPIVYTSGGTANYIGGTSSGSANAQIIASPIPSGFNLITGKSVTFIAGFTNNGPTQLNVNSTGLTNVFKQTASGAVAMVGGEIVLGQVYTAVFDGTEYQIQGPSPQGVVLPCTVVDWVGANGAPSGYLLMNGQAVSRTTFATLFSCIAVQGVAGSTSGSNVQVALNSAPFQVGWFVGGNNVVCNSVIVAIPDGSHINLNNTTTASGATTLTIGPFPQGDCSTTFNVGNFLGRSTIMRDTGGSVLTAATCTNPATIGSSCGAQTQQLTLAQLPTGITVTGTVSVSASGSGALFQGNGIFNAAFQAAAGTTGSFVAATNSGGWGQQPTLSGSNTLTSNNTSGAVHPILPPVALVDKYIKF